MKNALEGVKLLQCIQHTRVHSSYALVGVVYIAIVKHHRVHSSYDLPPCYRAYMSYVRHRRNNKDADRPYAFFRILDSMLA